MSIITEIAILVLAAFVGFEVISKVPNTLHTPLMSGTNAIHGIVLLGGLLLMHEATGVLEHVLLVIAIAFGTINVVGGFLVTDRMLGMFKSKPDLPPSGDDADERGRRAVIAPAVFLQTTNFIDALYIVAFSLFIYGMSGLTGPRTAVRGNKIAAVGMAIAVVATLLTPHVLSGSATPWLIAVGLVIGTAIGLPAALQRAHDRDAADGRAVQRRRRWRGRDDRVDRVPTPLLQRRQPVGAEGRDPDAVRGDRRLDLVLGLEHRVRQAPGDPAGPADQAARPGRRSTPSCSRSAWSRPSCSPPARTPKALFIVGILLAAAALGNMVVLPIGGADMPVVISLLNAFTGLSAAATGIALNNTAMIVAGMIVGASGTILTNLMAKAMNRSVPAIVAGGFGGEVAAPAGGAGGDGRDGPLHHRAQDVAIQLSYARLVVIAPGYGMAVAQAQHAVRELERALEAKGVEVKYAIHPVAGRMPGHMNVLLAEADVPYDLLREMDDINPEFSRTDVTLVIGANDVTNPAAKNEPGSPIYGMPILEVDKSALGDRPQALDGLRLRRDRQPAVLRPQDLDAVR